MRTPFMAKFALMFTAPCCAQQLRIAVVEAHHGKPVANECINVALGLWHGSDVLLRTDQTGLITLSITDDQVTGMTDSDKPCKARQSEMRISAATTPSSISVVPNWFVSCQYAKEQEKDPAWLSATPAQRIPTYAVAEILSKGVVTANHCSKLTLMPKPGELTLIVRKRTFVEGMKS